VAVSGQVAVPVVAVGVCGSDVARHRSGFAFASLGHEITGRQDDRMVAIRPLAPCGTCRACMRGWTEQCPQDMSIGRTDTGNGGFSGSVQVRPDQIYQIPGHLPVSVACLADPLACILHALREAPVSHADVLIIGDGAMAALAAIEARRRGARRIAISVKDDSRIERLFPFGDDVVTAGDLRTAHYDVVLESAGGVSSEPILTAAAAVAPLGLVIALGVFPPQVIARLPIRGLLEKEATLRGSKAYRASNAVDDFADALTLLGAAPERFAPVITATPRWSPYGPQPRTLKAAHALKTVYTLTSLA
jgi:threonine dehydrogenase-like Zn-dependent dehydrogenase